MSQILAHTELTAVSDFPGEWSLVGWKPPTSLSFNEWERIGEKLSQIDRALRWLIGDWLAYGEWKFGEKYAQAIDATRFNFHTLKDYSWVAANVPLSVRTEELSWTHHRYVAHLKPDEQKRWLDQAVENGWPSAELKSRVKNKPAISFSDNGARPGPEPAAELAQARRTVAVLKDALEAQVEWWHALPVEIEADAEPGDDQADAVSHVTHVGGLAVQEAREVLEALDDAATDLVQRQCPACGHIWSE